MHSDFTPPKTPAPFANLTVSAGVSPEMQKAQREALLAGFPTAEQIRAHVESLRHRLTVLQCRLGTPLETCADLDEAREITHTLRNYVQVKWLWGHTNRPGWDQLYQPSR